MQDGIVIKSSKAGMTVILNPDLPFPDLLASIAKKFGDSARFWGNAQMEGLCPPKKNFRS